VDRAHDHVASLPPKVKKPKQRKPEEGKPRKQ